MSVSRKKQREVIFQTMYMFEILGENADISKLLELSWTNFDVKDLPYVRQILEYALVHKAKLVRILKSQLSKEKSFESINTIDRAILYTSISEILVTKVDAAIIINEAVEISKKFSSENSHNLIHALLDNIYKNKDTLDKL